MSDSKDQEILLKLSAIDNLSPVMLKALQTMETNSAKMATALNQVGASATKTAENTEGLHGGLVSLEAGLSLAEAGVEMVAVGFEKLHMFMEKAIESSLEAERAQTRLTGALVATGHYTSGLNAELNEYAETLMKQTGVSAETVKGILATGLNMGLTTEKAEQLVSASQKLAAATGTDVQSAFQKMQSSLAGHARGLATSIAGVTDLSASQLKSGAAIDLVNKQLTAQFQLYQGSFSAGIERAHSGVEELYKTFGNLITQNPAIKESLSQFATELGQLNTWVEANSQSMKQWISQGILTGIDALEAMNVTCDALYRGGTAAFYGLEGALQSFALGVVSIVDGPFALLYKALSYLPGEQGKQFGAAADEIGQHLTDMAAAVNKSSTAIDRAMAGPTATSQAFEKNVLKVRDAVMEAVSSEGQHKKALEETNTAMSAQNAAALSMQKVYAGFNYGTLAQREALTLQVSDRDKDLKDFTGYLDARERLAVSKAAEQQMAVHAITSKALGGAVGGSDGEAQAQVAIDTEKKKQASLQVLRQVGAINQAQYAQALLASEQKTQTAELGVAQAFAKAKADALGTSAEGFAARQSIETQQQNLEIQQAKARAVAMGATATQQAALEKTMRDQFQAQRIQQQRHFDTQEITMATAQEKQLADLLGMSPAGKQKKIQLANQQFQMQLQQKKQHAIQEGLSTTQINQMAESENQTHLAEMQRMKEQWIQDDLALNQTLGNNWQVSLDQIALAQAKFGSVMGALQGAQHTAEFAALTGSLSNLATLRGSKAKGAFELGKASAIAGAVINIGQAAIAALAPPPIGAGPLLGPILAGTAIAAGAVQIAQISGQNFNAGGQADQGMDSIPSSLSGKSFVLSQGERVVQPEANKDLTTFLDKQKASGGGNTYNIELHYGGSGSMEDAKKMADIVIKEIRARSDRGTPIMNPKGLTS